ncbi:MAG: CsgG/HfaB family protein [Elusimicrobia bacterium]|nr:CsgG/HfaB family protein [Elusimicrobiota bacterium]
MKKKPLLFKVLLAFICVCAFNVLLTAQNAKVKVAVMDFKTIGDKASLGEGAAEILRTTLIETGKYTIIERSMLKQILEEQKLSSSGIVDSKEAVNIGKILGAKLIAVGSIVKLGETYTLNIRFVNGETGEVVQGKKLTAKSKEEIPGLCVQMVKLLSGGAPPKLEKKKETETKIEIEIEKPQKQTVLQKNLKPTYSEWSIGFLYPGAALKRIVNKHAWEIKVQSGSDIFVAGPRYYRYLTNSGIKIFWGLEADYIGFKGDESEGSGFAGGAFAGGEIPIAQNIGLSMDIGPMYINLSESDYSQSVSGLEYILNMAIYWHFK